MSAQSQRELAESYAQDALAWLMERKITPNPETFEVIYTYLAAQHVELKRNIDNLISTGGKLDDYILTILHQRHFRSQKMESAVVTLGEKMQRELDSVLRTLGDESRDRAALGQELTQASNELGKAPPNSVKTIEALVGRVIEATRRIDARSRLLEGKLQSATKEMSELRAQLETTRRESLTDPLTGLSNRKALDTVLQQEVEQSVETGDPTSLIMCDIDHFKTFNDSWGHETGDQVLRVIAGSISQNIKGRDLAVRYGGEEFIVVLPKTSLDAAVGLANQIRNTIESKVLRKKSTGANLGKVTVSAGVAQYDLNETIADFLRRVDCCMYAAKHAGRNRVVSEIEATLLQASAEAA